MDNIIEPTIDYDFSKLYLGPPSTLAGGAYFTRVMYNTNKQLFIQTPNVYQLAWINALFCTFIPMVCIMMAVQRIGSSMTAQAGTIGPVGTAFLGWYFLDEKISTLQLVGIAVVLIGIAILLSIGNKSNISSAPTE